MRSLSTAELLSVWEQGLVEPPIRWALKLLALACPEISEESLAELSIGQRDALLLTLREEIFGPKLLSLTTCPNCREHLELTLNAVDICLSGEKDLAKELSLETCEFYVKFRLPNSKDLMSISGKDQVESRQLLLHSCILEARHGVETISLGQMPADAVDSIVQRMAQIDPQATVELSICCGACNHQWVATFDIVSYLWTEINAWSNRLLRQVHCIASAYGWSEADIIAMAPQRRQFYLEMISS